MALIFEEKSQSETLKILLGQLIIIPTLILCSCSLNEDSGVLQLSSKGSEDPQIEFSLNQTTSNLNTKPAQLNLSGNCQIPANYPQNEARVSLKVASNSSNQLQTIASPCQNGSLALNLNLSTLSTTTQDTIEILVQIYGITNQGKATPSISPVNYTLFIGTGTSNSSCGQRPSGATWTDSNTSERSKSCPTGQTGQIVETIKITSYYICKSGRAEKTRLDSTEVISSSNQCEALTQSAQVINYRHQHDTVLSHDETWGHVAMKNTGSTTWTAGTHRLACSPMGTSKLLFTRTYLIDGNGNESNSNIVPGEVGTYRVHIIGLNQPVTNPVCSQINSVAYECWIQNSSEKLKSKGSSNVALASGLTFKIENLCPYTYSNNCNVNSSLGPQVQPARDTTEAVKDCRALAYNIVIQFCESNAQAEGMSVTVRDAQGFVSPYTKNYKCGDLRE